jgi:uncharacterized protein YjbJ (UPF0337 family)
LKKRRVDVGRISAVHKVHRNPPQGVSMNWDQIEGDWKQVKGKIKEQWGKLTDDHLDVIGGKRDQLVGKIQEEYGYTKERVEADLDHWTTDYNGTKAERPSKH